MTTDRSDELRSLLAEHPPISRLGVIGCRECGVWGRDSYLDHLQEVVLPLGLLWMARLQIDTEKRHIAELQRVEQKAVERTASACATATAEMLDELSPLTLPDLSRPTFYPTPA